MVRTSPSAARPHLGEVVEIAVGNHSVRAALEVAVGHRLVFEREPRGHRDHAALEDLAAGAMNHVERHDVEHLVGDDDAADLLGKLVEPHEAVEVLRKPLGEELALAVAQVRAHLEQQVLRGRKALRLELREEVGGEHARSRPDLEHVAARGAQHLARLHREAAREHRRDLGGGDEVAVHPELARAGGVVAELRRVEGELHVARERDPVVLVGDGLGDVLGDAPRMRRGFRHRRRQHGFAGKGRRVHCEKGRRDTLANRREILACRSERSW
jgi:hypothetical protein